MAQKDKDPDKLNELFVQITDDLSYSRTFYPNRSVRVYLNNLAQQIFYSIYKNKKTRAGRLLSFWTDELPHLVYESRIAFRASFIIFISAMIIGAFSSAMDPEFPRVILSDAYVDMTLENIESGDPMAVYKEKGQFGMSLGITANNLFVAFLTFVLGALYGIGSAAIMVQNGIMVGAFQYFFYEKGIFLESFLTIWTHGTLEISAIIIAGAAGLTMGRGLVFPGTLTRLQAFQVSARRGLKIMLGIAPIIILAAFIEGYLTRYTETPDSIRAMFIFACLMFILSYFVWYPWYKSRVGFKNKVKDTELPPTGTMDINFQQIKSSGEIFADIFVFTRKNMRKMILVALLGSSLYCFIVFVLTNTSALELFRYPSHLFGATSEINQYFVNEQIPWLGIPAIALFSALTFFCYSLLLKESKRFEAKPSNNYWTNSYLKVLLGTTLVYFILLTNANYTILLFCLVAPIIFLWMYVMLYENLNPFRGLGQCLNLIGGNYLQLLSLFFILMVTSFLFYSIMDSFLVWFYLDIIGWNFALEQEALNQLLYVSATFTSLLILCLIYCLFMYGMGLLYHTLIEIVDATDLKIRIDNIGKRRSIQGMKLEN
ncbi:MAG: stage II sporulation protein M [Bacteroidota bacterium]